MSTFPTNIDLNDTTPPPKPDAYNIEFQGAAPSPDPNVPGAQVKKTSGCYRTPHVGGVVVLTDDYDLGAPDAGWTFICDSSMPITLTLPPALPVLPNPEGIWNVRIENIGTGTVTVDPNGLTLNNSSSTVALAQNGGFNVSIDATGYWTSASGAAPGGTNHEVQINSAGAFAGLATGTAGQYLRSGGASADPAFASIAESEVSNLVSDLAVKAPLASPSLTGTPTAPTASPGTNTTQIATTAFVQAAIPASGLVLGFIINNGAAGTNVGPELLAPRAGSVTKCVIVTKTSDGTTGLTFRIKQNGVDVFTSNPSVAAGTASGTVSSSTSLTSNPLSVSASDVFTIDILSGSPNWAFTAQLES